MTQQAASEQTGPQQITKEEFHKQCPFHGHPAIHEEKEWFRLGDVLGVLIWDKPDRDWSHVLLLLGEGSLYRAADMGTCAKSAQEGRDALFEKMRVHHQFAQGPEAFEKQFNYHLSRGQQGVEVLFGVYLIFLSELRRTGRPLLDAGIVEQVARLLEEAEKYPLDNMSDVVRGLLTDN